MWRKKKESSIFCLSIILDSKLADYLFAVSGRGASSESRRFGAINTTTPRPRTDRLRRESRCDTVVIKGITNKYSLQGSVLFEPPLSLYPPLSLFYAALRERGFRQRETQMAK